MKVLTRFCLSDVVLELDDLDPEMELFEPLQRLLDQCKGAKVLSR